MTAKITDSRLNICIELGISLLIVATITMVAIGIFSLMKGYTFTEGVNHIYNYLNNDNAFEIICIESGICTAGLTMILYDRRKNGPNRKKQKPEKKGKDTKKQEQTPSFDSVRVKIHNSPPPEQPLRDSSTGYVTVQYHALLD